MAANDPIGRLDCLPQATIEALLAMDLAKLAALAAKKTELLALADKSGELLALVKDEAEQTGT